MCASNELNFVLKCVLDKGALSEQLIVTTIIWRLVANCYKAKHEFRCGSVLESLWSLNGRIAQSDSRTQGELALMIDALRLIFEK